MPASRPATLPTWATDANYPVESKPGDGQPTKLDPGSGVRAKGIRWTEEFAAPFFNWLLNLVGGWLAYLADPSTDATVNYPLASRSVQRQLPMAWRFAEATGTWTLDNTTGKLIQNGTASGDLARLSIKLPDGANLDTVRIRLKGAPAHGGVPALVPLLQLDIKDVNSANVVSYALPDPVTGGLPGYQANHYLQLPFLAETVNNTLYHYELSISPEQGANSLTGLQILGVEWLGSVDHVDSAAS